MEKWQEKLIPGRPDIEKLGEAETSVVAEGDPAALAQAGETAERTRELLATRGWCLWQCSTLGGEVIAVVRDELTKRMKDMLKKRSLPSKTTVATVKSEAKKQNKGNTINQQLRTIK